MKPDVSCQGASIITQLVCRSCIPDSRGAIPHVVRRIDDYVTPFLCHETFTAACGEGASVRTLDFLLEHVAPVWRKAVRAAARGGHMHVLQWERQDGRGPWKADFDGVLEIAAAHGHLELVQWLYARGMDWHTLWSIDECSPRYVEKTWLYEHCSSEALKAAAENGHLEVVQWIHSIRTDTCRTYAKPLDRAVANGHLAVAQWLYRNTSVERCSIDAIETAAKNGHLEMLQWLESHPNTFLSRNVLGCSTVSMDGAAANGHLDVLKWLQATHRSGASNALNLATRNGHLDVAQWLYSNFCFGPNAYVEATTPAENGHLAILQWLDRHFPAAFSAHVMDGAAENGHLDIVRWLHEHRSEGGTAYTSYFAAKKGHLDVLQFLHVHYSEKFRSTDMDAAAENGHLKVVQWLHENRLEGCTTRAMGGAASGSHLDVVLWLLEHRTEGFSSAAMETPQNVEVLCLFDSKRTQPHSSVSCSEPEQLNRLRLVFEQRPAFFRGCLRCLAEKAINQGNIALLSWVSQFGLELRSNTPIRGAVGRGDWRLLQWFYENGFQILEPDLLELAVEKGQLDVARWLFNHGCATISPHLIEMAGKSTKVSLLRWLVEHGPPLSLSLAATLAVEYQHVEISWWLAESERVRLVLAVLQKDDREMLWWILTCTRFTSERGQNLIRAAVLRAPKDTILWLQENFSHHVGCTWLQ